MKKVYISLLFLFFSGAFASDAKTFKEKAEKGKVLRAAGQSMVSLAQSPVQSPKQSPPHSRTQSLAQSPKNSWSPSAMSPKNNPMHKRVRSSDCTPLQQMTRTSAHWMEHDLIYKFELLEAMSDAELLSRVSPGLKDLPIDQIREMIVIEQYKALSKTYSLSFSLLSDDYMVEDAMKHWGQYLIHKQAGTLHKFTAHYVTPDVRDFNKEFEKQAEEFRVMPLDGLVKYAMIGVNESAQARIKKLNHKELLRKVLMREYVKDIGANKMFSQQDNFIFFHQEAERFCKQFVK